MNVLTVTNGVGSPYILLSRQVGSLINTDGAGAEVSVIIPNTLRVGEEFMFYVSNLWGMRVNVQAGEYITNGVVTSSNSGYMYTSGAASVGSYLRVVKATTTKWVGYSQGVWNADGGDTIVSGQFFPDINFVEYDDVQFPAAGMNPTGLPSPPTVDNTDGTLLFASGADNIVGICFQIPHGWSEGTAIGPHIHWCKTTAAAGTVKWQLKYSVQKPGAVLPSFSSFTDGTDQVADADTANLHAIRKWAEITTTGMTVSTICKFVLQRTSSGGADTYAANAKLLSFDIHVAKDSNGSRSEWVK